MNTRLIDALNTIAHTNIIASNYDPTLDVWSARTTWGEVRVFGERGASWGNARVLTDQDTICIQRREGRARKWSTVYVLASDPDPTQIIQSLYL